MAKKIREQSTVSEVQRIEKPMGRSERDGRGTAVSIRLRSTSRLLSFWNHIYKPSEIFPEHTATISINLLESFQSILLLTNRSNVPSRTF